MWGGITGNRYKIANCYILKVGNKKGVCKTLKCELVSIESGQQGSDLRLSDSKSLDTLVVHNIYKQ